MNYTLETKGLNKNVYFKKGHGDDPMGLFIGVFYQVLVGIYFHYFSYIIKVFPTGERNVHAVDLNKRDQH